MSYFIVYPGELLQIAVTIVTVFYLFTTILEMAIRYVLRKFRTNTFKLLRG